MESTTGIKPTESTLPATGPTPIDSSFPNFQAALGANVLLAVGFLLAFVVLRPLFPLTYQPRVSALPASKRPAELNKSFVSVFLLLKTNDKELLERCGHDAFAAIFYTRTVTILFLAIAIPAAILLLPINITGGGGLSGMNILTIGNVQNQDKLWAHFFFTVYVCTITVYAIFRLISQTARLRQSFQTSPSQSQALAARTLMARDVPREWRNEDALKCIFDRICPDSVEAVILSASVPHKLSKHVSNEIKARNNLEVAVASFFSKAARKQPLPDTHPEFFENQRPRFRDPPLYGKKTDAIAHYSMQFRKAREEISKTRENLGMDDAAKAAMVASSTAFIVFRKPFQASLVARATIHDAPAVMSECIQGVADSDVVWETSGMNYFARQWRSLAAKAILVFLTLFWAAIVTSTLAFANLDNIGSFIGFVHDFVIYNPRLAQVIGGILPPIIIAGLIQLVPPILRFLAVHSGSPLKTKMEQDVFAQFFVFQLCNIVFVNIVGTSLLTSITEIKDNPESIIRILGISIPQSANFFVQYLLVTGMTRPSGEILRIASLILNPINAWLFGKTPRTLFASTKPPQWRYAADMGAHGISASIGLIFCVIAPIVSCFATVYFGFYYAVYLYQFQYVYRIKHETGGKFLFVAAKHMFAGLFIMEFMITSLFSINLNFPITGLMLVVIAITLWSYSQALSFISVIDSIPVKTILDMEGITIPSNPTTPFRTDETLQHHFAKVFTRPHTRVPDHDENDHTDPNVTLTTPTPAEPITPLTDAHMPPSVSPPPPSTTTSNTFTTSLSKSIAFLLPGQDTSKYSTLITFFFPGLVVAASAVPTPTSHTPTTSNLPSLPENLFAHPKDGFKKLKVWIPESRSQAVTQSVVREICGDEEVVVPRRVVSCGASVDRKGNVVLSEEMYEMMNKM
ncbi:hypothetical protein HDU98_002916 [Podochytrium sp. JEL0797]|nr:hypothetical protein HDU98_002916 [Podochytrium sp. JEL0797]